MNRTEELREEIVATLECAIREFEDGGNPEMDGDYVAVSYITAKRTVELLKKLEVPVEAVWHYYVNDEGKARWKCGNCGKIVRRLPKDKKRCSTCGAYMREEC